MAAPDSGRLTFHAGETPLWALVAEAQRGDADAFMVLLETHDRMLRSIAFRVLGDRDQMDDALQEVALKAFAALPKFRGAILVFHLALPHRLQHVPQPAPRSRSNRVLARLR